MFALKTVFFAVPTIPFTNRANRVGFPRFKVTNTSRGKQHLGFKLVVFRAGQPTALTNLVTLHVSPAFNFSKLLYRLSSRCSLTFAKVRRDRRHHRTQLSHALVRLTEIQHFALGAFNDLRLVIPEGESSNKAPKFVANRTGVCRLSMSEPKCVPLSLRNYDDCENNLRPIKQTSLGL